MRVRGPGIYSRGLFSYRGCPDLADHCHCDDGLLWLCAYYVQARTGGQRHDGAMLIEILDEIVTRKK